MEIISQHFFNVSLIQGGFQFNLGYAGAVTIVCLLLVKRSLKRRPS